MLRFFKKILIWSLIMGSQFFGSGAAPIAIPDSQNQQQSLSEQLNTPSTFNYEDMLTPLLAPMGMRYEVPNIDLDDEGDLESPQSAPAAQEVTPIAGDEPELQPIEVPTLTAEDLGGEVPKKIADATSFDLDSVKKDKDFNKLPKDYLAVDKEEMLKPFDPEQRKWFDAIAQVESSGGKMRIHENAGTSRAIGSFGILPTTGVADVIQRGKGNFATAYPEEFEKVKEALKNKDWVGVGKIMADPNIEAEVAKDYRKINRNYIKRLAPNLPKSVLKPFELLVWNQGISTALKIYKKDGEAGVRSHPYVKKVMKYLTK